MTQQLHEAFPFADAGVKPLGSRILVQIRTPMNKSTGGIILSHNDKDTEKWNTQIARIVECGPLAFRNRNTKELWPEGEWCGIGDFVRVPKYGGDRWEVDVEGSEEKALFVLFNDLDMLGKVTVDPLKIKAFF